MPIRVAIQGELGSNSECAGLDFFPQSQIVPCRDYGDVFRALENGAADRLAIPIENSTAGSIYPYYDLLLQYATSHQFQICGELKLKIRHNLLGLPGTKISSITEVRSHYQALDQCREYLAKNGLRPVAVYDTSGAAKEIREQGLAGIAAIASTQAAADFGLEVLAPNIQDRTDNYTRFLCVTKGATDPVTAPMAKTSVAFCIANVEGSLFRTLAAFGSRRNVNLIRIESRPLTGTMTRWMRYQRQHSEGQDDGVWDLVYYVDFVAPTDKTASVLSHLGELVLERDGLPALQVLGTYAEGGLRDLTGSPWRK